LVCEFITGESQQVADRGALEAEGQPWWKTAWLLEKSMLTRGSEPIDWRN